MDEIKSKYHSGNFRESRRNKLWEEVNFHSRSGLFIKWNEDLDTVWSELCADLKEDDYNKKKEEFSTFDIKILEVGRIEDSSSNGFAELSKEFHDKRDKHYKILRDKEVFLRRLENFLGKSGDIPNNEEYD
jgi:hypothetical protein